MNSRSNWLLCGSAGVLCAALNWLFLRHAVWMAPDSWAFWQGSVSLLDGRGYRLFANDEPIREWPPLYSFYLAAWQAAFGVSGKVLIAAQSALAGLSALAWTRLALSLGGARRGTVPILAAYAQAVFILVFVATRYDCIRADNLKYVLLPLLIAACEQAWRATSTDRLLRACAGLGGLGMLLMLTHTSSVAFVGAAVLVVLLTTQIRLSARLLGAALSAGTALVPWLISRHFLHQTGSHRIGVGVAAFKPLAYAAQALGGSTTLLIKQPWLAAPLALLIGGVSYFAFDPSVLGPRALAAVRVRLLFVASALLLLFSLFNVTYITDKLTGRFVFFVPLTLVPVALALLASGKRPALFLACAALIELAGVPRILDLARGVQASHDGLAARPEQLALENDCVRRPDAHASWSCSAATLPRLPPPEPNWSRP